jgi:hypothetical protein
MAKGPQITDEVRILAAKLCKEHPRWKNKEIRNWIVASVHKADPSLPKGWPSKYAIDRILPDIREELRKQKVNPNPLDRPWSLDDLRDNPMPPEVLPKVFKLWGLGKEVHKELTNREVKWVVQLSAMTDDLFRLWNAASLCARWEQISELANFSHFSKPLWMADLYSILTNMTEDEKKVCIEAVSGRGGFFWPKIIAEYPPEIRKIHEESYERGKQAALEALQKKAQNERKHKAKK